MIKQKILTFAMAGLVSLGLTACAGASEVNESTEQNTGTSTSDENTESPDYSQRDRWLQIPEITKDIDTIYIYSTAYIESSFEEGAPDYAMLDNEEMLTGAAGEYMTNASVFEDSTNVFVPYYRQAGIGSYPKTFSTWQSTTCYHQRKQRR